MQSYGQLFRQHVGNFMQRHQLWPRSTDSDAWVAISGGMDSMCLLHVIKSLQRERGGRGTVKAVSVDHRSRPGGESGRDVAFCRRQCQRWEIPFYGRELPERVAGGNREHRWHQLRGQLWRQLLGPGELLYQGHHLDDSLEWHLLGMLKSSSRYIPGIPVVNDFVHRPLLCVSRAQIARYVGEEGIPFVEDSSNEDVGIERNFLRQTMAPLAGPLSQIPQALRNETGAVGQGPDGGGGRWRELRDGLGGILLWSWDARRMEEGDENSNC